MDWAESVLGERYRSANEEEENTYDTTARATNALMPSLFNATETLWLGE
jgi:hypothetical protein